ncbi:hypothetical protein HPB49_019296 [Dermacentor silvarum]|uniref:Uncharacterized protein n=1 Tax=Dermacentor silvarum TaxID=543639 RepID=A0ACB8CGV1_DERSI|nr:hypothetical protein HPB49_019296 [Dermacentor silvarum]
MMASLSPTDISRRNPQDEYELVQRVGSGTYGDVYKRAALRGGRERRERRPLQPEVAATRNRTRPPNPVFTIERCSDRLASTQRGNEASPTNRAVCTRTGVGACEFV